MSTRPKIIQKPAPTVNCDVCGQPAKYDVKTTSGPWAYLCDLDALTHSTPNLMSIGYTWEG